MKKGYTYFLILTATLISILACERDDICVDTPITPFLTITFQDNDPSLDVSKIVTRLQVTLLENNEPYFVEPVSVDSIQIPLSTITDKTVFQFTRNVNDANEANIASDTLSFSYSREEEFVNRACGFKTIYSNLEAIINEDRTEDDIRDNNWIQKLEIINTTIDDEPNTHIRLFH